MGSTVRITALAGLFAILGSSSAQGGDLVDILPDLVPAAIVSPSGLASTLRPDTGGGTRTDTGPAFGTFATQPDLGSISSSAFQDFQNLPVGSAVAAFTYEFDEEKNVFVPSKQGLGPIFADRAQTMGKDRFNFGVSWSHIDFDEFEGTDLGDFPIPTQPFLVVGETFSPPNLVDNTPGPASPFGDNDSLAFILFGIGSNSESYTLPDDDVSMPPVTDCTRQDFDFCSLAFPDGGFGIADGPVGDYTTSFVSDPDISADIDLTVELINLYGAYGVTDNFDVGILLPILTVDMDAQISFMTFDFSAQAFQDIFMDPFFDTCPPSDPVCQTAAILLLSADVAGTALGDEMDPGTAVSTTLTALQFKQKFSNSGDSAGVGDLMIRGKYRFLETSYIDMAGRLDISFPTGDEDNFRGTGEYMWGLNLIASKAFGWFSPHANLTMQLRTGGKENHQFRWMVGADAKLHERVAASVDFVGNEDLYHDGIGDTQMAVAPGLKFNPWKNLVVSTAAVIRVNHQGLRADVIPSLGVEYTFF